MKWLRFRMRTLLTLVALTALAMGAVMLHRRAERFQREAALHAKAENDFQGELDMGMSGPIPRSDESGSVVIIDPGKRVTYHAAMKRKYEYATLHPWLLLPPDPPPP